MPDGHIIHQPIHPVPLKSYVKGGGRINIRLSMPQLIPLFTSLVFVHSGTTGN